MVQDAHFRLFQNSDGWELLRSARPPVPGNLRSNVLVGAVGSFSGNAAQASTFPEGVSIARRVKSPASTRFVDAWRIKRSAIFCRKFINTYRWLRGRLCTNLNELDLKAVSN